MAFYTVMIPPPGSGGARDEIEQAQLLPETFAWPAFVFGGFWLLGKRLWLATLLYVLLWGALLYASNRFGMTTAPADRPLDDRALSRSGGP